MKNLLEAANPVATINLRVGVQEIRHARSAMILDFWSTNDQKSKIIRRADGVAAARR
jgi:hypothetical protein